MDGGLQGLVAGVDGRARIVRSGQLAWEIAIDGDSAVAEEHLAVQVAKGTVLYQTRLQDHIGLLQV